MNFLKEYKATFIFVGVVVLIIALLAVNEARNKNKEYVDPQTGTEERVLIEPTKYQDIGENYPIATITMENGDIMKLQLYPNIAPNTVENFIYLANSGFYDGLTFHRIYKDFMIQGGDPKGDGTGDPGYSIVGEFSNNGYKNELSHKKGVISMARSYENDSAGCQFFIVLEESSFLDGDYTAFGELIEGLDVLEKLEQTEVYQEEGSDEVSKPVNPPVIKNIKVETFGIEYSEPERIS